MCVESRVKVSGKSAVGHFRSYALHKRGCGGSGRYESKRRQGGSFGGLEVGIMGFRQSAFSISIWAG